MTEPDPVRDAAGEEIREGKYRSCPICGLLFRDPLQDVDPLSLAISLPNKPGGPPNFELSERYHQLMSEQERVLQAHVDTHTMIEAIEVIVRLQRERDRLREWRDTVRSLAAITQQE